MNTYLEFEKPVQLLDNKIFELRGLNESAPSENLLDEITQVEQQIIDTYEKIYSSITPWQRTLVARHPERPRTKEYIQNLIEDFFPLSGDRFFSDDKAIIGGFGKFRGKTVLVIGHEKGHDTTSRIAHNFGMPRPEGYRKAQRLMKLAEDFDIPVISFVDTPGAYPGVGAEQRGQSEAIAKTTECCLSLGVPIIAVIIGEGGSGGAVAIGTGNTVLMLENSIYSVISPEGCSSILWKDNTRTIEAAAALKLTADDMLKIDVIDKVVQEPIGGAHRNPHKAIEDVGNEIEKYLNLLSNQHGNDLKHSRQERYLQIGRSGLFSDKTTTANSVLNEKYGKSKHKNKLSFFSKTLSIIVLTIFIVFIIYYLF